MASVDITSDNQDSFDEGYNAGVASLDITSAIQSMYLVAAEASLLAVGIIFLIAYF